MINRILFALRYKTLRRMAEAPGASTLAVYHKGAVVELGRRCPHQGAPLIEGHVEGDFLLCPWHGCRFSLGKKQAPRPYDPTK